ncbi:DUF5320 domain-containing protein [Draconibacterium halophilum]|uniref:DUF5320 domain-containing protein n=1 Tax=Draconibacterium halophilum TaxID=2706887 RepID=A0A6C0RE95_9BACT|nr:DUF5320 domain-containing protein [Draconibacterium halophilum]QIA08387.1 DUF5320 domain-containing protein [Draconibacterium halophilum]
MPGLNQTGPMGQGAQTGRKQGRCNNELNDEQLANFGRRGGKGFRFKNPATDESLPTGWGRGKGRGRGRRFGRLEN